MAKVTSKKTSLNKGKAPKKKSSPPSIDQVCTEVLAKLKALNIEESLQSEIAWCLGSYRHDHNPSGLFEMIARAEKIFQQERAKKTKGITLKFINQLKKVR